MTTKGIAFTLLLVLTLAFALLNLEVLSAPARVKLLVAAVSLPLGLVLVGVLVLLSACCFVLALLSEARQLKETRALEREILALRGDLEGARFGEVEHLEARLGQRLDALEKRLAGLAERGEDKLDKAQAQLDARLLTVRNELAADIAELAGPQRRAPGAPKLDGGG